MQTGFDSPLLSVALNHRVRTPLIAGMLAASLAVSIATGILLPRVSSDAGQVGEVSIRPPSTMIDSWRIAVPAVPAVPTPRTMIDSWRIAVPAVPADPTPRTMIDSWRIAVQLPI